jgi:hypothetical protein
MKYFKTSILPVFLATAWISISEFARNEFLVKSMWIRHYQNLGLAFPDQPVNGAVWGAWSLMFAMAVFMIARKFSLLQTTIISWFFAFAMMWVVLGNLSVLPAGLLWYAIPLSMIESFVASLIIKSFQKKQKIVSRESQ